MTWSNVKLIFHRELRDQLRDRRTLFMILVLPILLYPMIGIGLVQFTVLFAEQPRVIALVGREHLPDFPGLIDGDRFAEDLFTVPEDAEKLRIVFEASLTTAKAKLEDGEVQLILAVPPNIREQIAGGHGFTWQSIAYKSADDKSRFAYLLLREVLENWKEQIIRSRIAARSLDPDFVHPFKITPVDISTPEQVSGGLLWAKLFPFLLVVMSLTGAFYPAVDLCAGEKERGTIETLLISPARRSEIVLGKYLTIWLFSMATAVLNLLSMALTGWVVAEQMKHALPANVSLSVLAPPSAIHAVWILLLLVPLAAQFSAMGIALAAFARSTKEGQYYLTPLFLVTMPLVLVTLAPGTELNAFYSMVPVTGAALLLKTLIQGQYDVAAQYFIPVLLPTVLYAVLALRWAIDQFNREEVLFREAERLDLWLWTRHLFRDKEPVPSAAEAVFCFCIMLLLVWFLGGFLSPAAVGDEATRHAAMQRSLIVLQLAFVAAPSLIMAVMLTTSARRTLLLLRPSWSYVVLAIGLAVCLHPIVIEATRHLHRGIPTQPKWVEDQLKQLLGDGEPLWWQLFLIALLPAMCEELAFRGFILSGLLRRMSAPTAIIVSGFLFGFFHMNPQQLLTATVLGWILGLIATRTGSLLPGILFHFTNNSLALLTAGFQEQVQQPAADGVAPTIWTRLFELLYRPGPADAMAYGVHVLVLCALLATAMLTWLLKQPIRSPAAMYEMGVREAGPDGMLSGTDEQFVNGLDSELTPRLRP